MQNSTTLFVVNYDTSDHVIAEAAEAAAQNQSHLSCLLIGSAPALPVYAYGVPPYGAMNIPDNWKEMIEEDRQTELERVQQIEALLARSGASGDVASVRCATMDINHFVARQARVCDLVLLAPNLRDTPDIMRETAYGVLFKSPTGLMINGSTSLKADLVFVAWDSSEAAATSVHVALPYLKAAKEVIVGCFDPVMTEEKDGGDPGTDVATWLSRHGCKVTVSQYPSGGREIGQCIQERAKEAGVDLVVLGAYGHARMIEAVFGGTTRTMIEQIELPILIAH